VRLFSQCQGPHNPVPRVSKPKILLQLDGDSHASSFDAVVAIDAGVDHLLSHATVRPENVLGLVHGCMFTRGPDDLRHTAIFVGGSDVEVAEANFQEVCKSFFGPIRCSVMLDGNGCNTTAAAAVLAAGKHVDITAVTALVLGGTGPVGQRVARLLAGNGAQVRIGSRRLERAEATCSELGKLTAVNREQLTPIATHDGIALDTALVGVQLVVSAGAAGAVMLPATNRAAAADLQVAIDLNAVPPAGIEGVEVTAKAKSMDGLIVHGAIGVGGTKMKIHKAAIRQLLQTNDAVLDAEEILAIGKRLN